MKKKNDFALVPRPATTLEKVAPGAKRILSGMIADTLALVKKEPTTTRVFRVLTCFMDENMTEALRNAIELYLGSGGVAEATHIWGMEEILEHLKEQSVDLIIPWFNNMSLYLWRDSALSLDEKLLKTVEILASLKAQYHIPILALSGYIPPSFDLPERLKQGGIDAFLWTPIPQLDQFHSALKSCGIVSKSQKGKT